MNLNTHTEHLHFTTLLDKDGVVVGYYDYFNGKKDELNGVEVPDNYSIYDYVLENFQEDGIHTIIKAEGSVYKVPKELENVTSEKEITDFMHSDKFNKEIHTIIRY